MEQLATDRSPKVTGFSARLMTFTRRVRGDQYALLLTSEALPKGEKTMRISCNIISGFFVIILLISTAPLSAVEPRKVIDPVSIIEKIDAAGDGVGVLSLPVTINDKTYRFILDTGSAGVVYDVSFRSILGKSKKNEKVNSEAGIFELAAFDSPEAFIGKIRLKTTSNVVMSDLKSIREWSGVDYYGVIGMSFLRKHILKIDFDKGEVLFLKSLEKDPGQALAISYQHGVIYTEALLPGLEPKEKFLIATGSDTNVSGTISNRDINMLTTSHMAKRLSSNQESISLSGSTVKKVDFRLNSFTLGPFTVRNPIFSTSKKADNQLGLGYLSRFVVTFDFPRKVMYLKKGKAYDLPDGRDRSGLRIARHAGKTVATEVGLFSPAWWAGIRPQDEILRIEGYSAKQTSLYSLRRLLCQEGKNVNLLLQKGQGLTDVSVKLR